MTYSGLESCILNSYSYDNESGGSRADGVITDSLDGDDLSCSSSKDAFGSFSSQWLMNKQEENGSDDWEISNSPQHFYAREKPAYTMEFSDVETMKEKFAKLLLGEDVSGGCKGLSTALALSNAITNLAASVFGELWKLEPLPEERKRKWQREMDWLLSPANYMVQLVPAKQNGINGRILEIMTPKARSDIHVNLPALQKLDSILIEILDSMVNTEYWYAEGGSKAEGRSRSRSNSVRQSMKWWLPSPRVPTDGLSSSERKKLVWQGKLVHQIIKAAKSINDNILLEMPFPTFIGDTLPKSVKASLGEDLYRAITMESSSIEDILCTLDLKNEHSALDTANRLEAATFIWRDRISNEVNGKSPVRKSWSFIRESISELDKMELWLERAEALLQLLKNKFPNLPQTFLHVTKIQYNKDVGHSILEAYSRVLGSLAFSILSRIGDILQEDDLNKPDSLLVPMFKFDRFFDINLTGLSESPATQVKNSLLDQMDRVDGSFCQSNVNKHAEEFFDTEAKTSTTLVSPLRRSKVWCYGREACASVSPPCSP
eukprot:TRINITY_DN21073_c0_g1_i1.p1 TRINITY_DN21073_c0_g1~~TRINITY_DN21073_c0_g1_i1.p1  ORF type:complete len:546 (-),score=95.93 TRINITY_DN21073_c0_g1_i1:328-1965(-)